jgi:hypothetical protein
MPLIPCPECRGSVSTSATQCPHCGFPLASPAYAAPAAPPPPPPPVQWGGPAAPPPRRGSGTGLIVGIVAGLGALGLLGFVGLIALGASVDSATRQASSDTTASFSGDTADFSAAGDSTPAAPPENLAIEEDTSEMDGSATVVLTALADADIQGWSRSVRPSLIVRCREGKTDVYVATGVQANPEYGHYQEVTVRYRLDETPPRRQVWGESTSGEALFAPEPVTLARALSRASQFRFEFTPFQASAQTVSFAVSGLETKLARVADSCHWHI